MRKAIKAILIIVAVIILIIAFLVILPLLKPDIVPKEEIKIKVDKTILDQDEVIKANIESEKTIFTGFPAFEVQQLVDDEWQYVDIYDMACAFPCSWGEKDICAEMPIACAPLPEHCQNFDFSVNKFEWDQTILKTRNIECPNSDETRICSFKEIAEPGTYKIVFRYSENCVNEDLFEAEENKVKEIEKEFIIRPKYIKVDDFFGEWPIYYDKYVEFEGYITSVYECMPPERCLEPYFLVYKQPLPHRYYEIGHVIIKHIFGEELEEGRKYRIRGRLLPPEQAFLIEIVGTLPNAESRIVIDSTEPAMEIKK